MTEHYTPEFLFKVFQEIDQGLYTNAKFSHSNVVMVSKEHYGVLCDTAEKLQEELQQLQTRIESLSKKRLRSIEQIKKIEGDFRLCSLCGGKMFPGVAINPKLGINARYIAPQSPLSHRNLEIINVLKCSVCGASETNEDFKNEQQ